MALILPQWLDDYIFEHEKAEYYRCLSDMTVIDWGKSDVLKYLGTYFPRSYAESYSLFSGFLAESRYRWINMNHIDVFDFGCGTGGQLIGMLTSICENQHSIASVTVNALDGNKHSLRICERIVSEFQKRSNLKIEFKPFCLTIDDLYDLNLVGDVVTGKYDIVLSFKAICEFITKARFAGKNAYEQFVRIFIPKIKPDGIMLMADVTTFNKQANEWLPKIMDEGLSTLREDYEIASNQGYSETFAISHSRRSNDTSKIAWRIITSK